MRKNNWKSATTSAWVLAIVLLVGTAVTQSAQAQTFNAIYDFTGGTDGSGPQVLTVDPGGVLYGTTFEGAAGFGGVYQLRHTGSSWIFNSLYSFAGGSDGAGGDTLTIGPDGSLYGGTYSGGTGSCNSRYRGCGTIFNLRVPPNAVCGNAPCPWTETILYRFSGGADGWGVISQSLAFEAGNIYSTNAYGANGGCAFGDGCGVVYELSPSQDGWTERTLNSFTGGADGGNPYSGVIFDQVGNLYGTTLLGGAGDCGTVFQLTHSGSSWVENVLYTFTGGSDGGGPYSGLISDNSGNLYGATYGGSTFGSCAGADATVFELMPSNGGWTFVPIYDFHCTDCGPYGPSLVMDGAGDLWGTAYRAGAYGYGMVFELTPSRGGWTFHDVHDFTGGSDGALPRNIAFDVGGNLYGITFEGGSGLACNGGCGVVFEVTP